MMHEKDSHHDLFFSFYWLHYYIIIIIIMMMMMMMLKGCNLFFSRLDFDSSFYPHLDHQANMIHATSVNETNTSMHMKALALKYLSDEQLADIAWHKQLSNMQGTNMSLATMRYLERYQLLPGKNVQTESEYQAMK